MNSIPKLAYTIKVWPTYFNDNKLYRAVVVQPTGTISEEIGLFYSEDDAQSAILLWKEANETL